MLYRYVSLNRYIYNTIVTFIDRGYVQTHPWKSRRTIIKVDIFFLTVSIKIMILVELGLLKVEIFFKIMILVELALLKVEIFFKNRILVELALLKVEIFFN